MDADDVQPNEATLTSVARLATATHDPAMAFSVVRYMDAAGTRCASAPTVRPSSPTAMPKTPTGRRERKKRIRVREKGILDTSTGWAHMSELANGKKINRRWTEWRGR
jgi:hypothetical protein